MRIPRLYTLDDRARAQLSRIQSCGLVKHPYVEVARMYTIVGGSPSSLGGHFVSLQEARPKRVSPHHTTTALRWLGQ